MNFLPIWYRGVELSTQHETITVESQRTEEFEMGQVSLDPHGTHDPLTL